MPSNRTANYLRGVLAGVGVPPAYTPSWTAPACRGSPRAGGPLEGDARHGYADGDASPRVAQTESMTSTTCPSWCHIKHPEGETEPCLHFGPHWPPLRGHEGFSADVASVQNKNGDIGVWLSADHEEYLTTTRARSVARALFAAADWVDAKRHS